MKLLMKNDKGFAASIYIYSMFLFFIIIITMILVVITSEDQSLTYGTDVVKKDVDKIVPYNIKLGD